MPDAATTAHPNHKLKVNPCLEFLSNPATRDLGITYQVHRTGSVRVTLIDAAGRTVSELVNKVQAPGEYCTSLASDQYAQGVYFVHVQVDAESALQKVIFMR